MGVYLYNLTKVTYMWIVNQVCGFCVVICKLIAGGINNIKMSYQWKRLNFPWAVVYPLLIYDMLPRSLMIQCGHRPDRNRVIFIARFFVMSFCSICDVKMAVWQSIAIYGSC
jgi:cytochrome c oxidase subunit IV